MKKHFTTLLAGAAFVMAYVVCITGCANRNKSAVQNKANSQIYQPTSPALPAGFYDPSGLISAKQHGVLDTVQKGFFFTEGPAVNKQGDIFFTDQPADKIYKWDSRSKTISLFLSGTGRANGMTFDKSGNLIACAEMHGEIWKIAPDGSHSVLVNNYNGKVLNGPNDVWINPVNGGIYITDPIFPRDFWDKGDPRRQSWPPSRSEQAASGKGGHVYYLAPNSHSLIRVTTMDGWNPDSWPNGITGSTDGKKLYVNNWTPDASGNIWEFTINDDGTLSGMKTFVTKLTGGDGMSIDQKGNIYVSGGVGLNAYDKNGEKLLTIPARGGTNNVFGGKNNNILFMTSPDRVTMVQMNVKGVEKR